MATSTPRTPEEEGDGRRGVGPATRDETVTLREERQATTGCDASVTKSVTEPDRTPGDHAATARTRDEAVTVLTVVPGGPVLVSGPVDVELPDGSFARSDRVVTAVCTCRRSKRMPWCDTSHRARRAAPSTPPAPNPHPNPHRNPLGNPHRT